MKNLFFAGALLFLSSCTSYKYADKIKMVSFSDDVKKGKSVGAIQGKDCTVRILQYWLGGAPTLDKAFKNAQGQDGSFLTQSGFSSDSDRSNDLRYINNVSTENTGFDIGIVARKCLVVNGVGYK